MAVILLSLPAAAVASLVTSGIGGVGALLTWLGYRRDGPLKRLTVRGQQISNDTEQVQLVDALQQLVLSNGKRLVELQSDTLKNFNANIELQRSVAELQGKLQVAQATTVSAITERDAIELEIRKLRTECELEQAELRRQLDVALLSVREKDEQLVSHKQQLVQLEARLAELTINPS